MLGGGRADEFQLLIDAGEDNIVIRPKCGYKSNMEVADSVIEKCKFEDEKLTEIYTAEAKTIDEVCQYLNVSPKQTIKAVCYAVVGNDEQVVIAFVRGDREINEAKLKKVVGADVVVKDLQDTGLVKGNIGPVGLNGANLTIVFDTTLEGQCGMIAGANKDGYHLKGVNIERDVKNAKFFDIAKVIEGDKCKCCGDPLTIKKGIEVGNIFQLGTKYTKSMGMTIHMPDGSQINPIMGCYGIGIGRSLAAVVEESADEKGIVWPMSIAPWHIYLCPLKNDLPEIFEKAESLYQTLSKDFEVLYDDRKTSPGVKLTDSELMGIPVRVVISPRSLENNQAEVTIRKNGDKIMVNLDELNDWLKNYIRGEING